MSELQAQLADYAGFGRNHPEGVSGVETVSQFVQIASDYLGEQHGELVPTGRGIGSCYMELPAFAGPYNLAEELFYYRKPEPAGPQIVQGESDLSLHGATATTDSGTGPTTLGDPTQWKCRPVSDPNVPPACG